MSKLKVQAAAELDKFARTSITPAPADVRAGLEFATNLARKCEAGKAVTGGFDSGIISMVESFASIATPMVAILGDYELSNLLGSLKVWLAKKRAEAEAEKARVNSMTNQSWDTMNFNYSF